MKNKNRKINFVGLKSAIKKAIDNNEIYIFEILIQRYLNKINCIFTVKNKRYYTLLSYASVYGSINIVKIILSFKETNLNYLHKDFTALHYACLFNKNKIVKLLLMDKKWKYIVKFMIIYYMYLMKLLSKL